MVPGSKPEWNREDMMVFSRSPSLRRLQVTPPLQTSLALTLSRKIVYPGGAPSWYQCNTSSIGNFLSLRLIENYLTIFAFNTFCLFQLNLNLISIIKVMFHDRIRLVVSFAICHALPQPKCRCNN